MPVVAFFPWLKIKEKIVLGNIKLTPYNIEQDESGSNIKKACNKVFSSYCISSRPVSELTVLSYKDKLLFDDITDEEINDLFIAAEFIAFSAISRREYFQFSGNYCNKDDFLFYIQIFDETFNGAHFKTRKRDGLSEQFSSSDNLKTIKPDNATNRTVNIDKELLASLLELQKNKNTKAYNEIFEAIYSFNRANTDNNYFNEPFEIVLVLGAIQRILGCSSSDITELSRNFIDFFKPSIDLKINESQKLKNVKHIDKIKIIREEWIRDLYKLRGDFAHGKLYSNKNIIWSVREHLLLASYVFSLLVKCRLEKEGYYKLIEKDEYDETGIYQIKYSDLFQINVFEKLLDADLFTLEKDEDGEDNWPWIRIIAGKKLRDIIEEEVRLAGITD